MATSKGTGNEHGKGNLAMKTPPIVSQEEWETARQRKLLLKEKALTRSRDALAAERRRMPWLAVDKNYKFEGPKGKVSPASELFEGAPPVGPLSAPVFRTPGCSRLAPEHACHAAARWAPTRSRTLPI